jgi:hypothetical protein
MNGKLVPHLGPMENPANAVWCPTHGKLECDTQRESAGKKVKGDTRTDTRCHGPAIRGTSRCSRHSGKSRAVALMAGEATITAWSAMGKPAPGQSIDPGMAVMGMLQMAWMRAHAYGDLLRRQVMTDVDRLGLGLDLTHDEMEAMTLTQIKGLIGHKMGSGGQEGTLYVQSEEIRALVALESQERDRVVKFAEIAHKMGISDRLTTMAEKWGDVVAGHISSLLADLNLSAAQQRKVPELLVRHLSVVDIFGPGQDK